MLVVQRVINGQSARVDVAMARVANVSAGAEDSMWCVKLISYFGHVNNWPNSPPV